MFSRTIRIAGIVAGSVLMMASAVIDAHAALPTGKQFPALKLNTITGQKVDVSKLRGKVVLVDVWATWCPPCRMEIPHLQKLQSRYGRQGLTVIGISIGEGKAKPQAFAKANKLSYTIAYTDDTAARDVVSKLNVEPIPTTYIIDKKGVIRYAQEGFAPEVAGQFEKTIKQLLAAK